MSDRDDFLNSVAVKAKARKMVRKELTRLLRTACIEGVDAMNAGRVAERIIDQQGLPFAEKMARTLKAKSGASQRTPQ